MKKRIVTTTEVTMKHLVKKANVPRGHTRKSGNKATVLYGSQSGPIIFARETLPGSVSKPKSKDQALKETIASRKRVHAKN